jgi:5-hydroxyisourate hydrolase
MSTLSTHILDLTNGKPAPAVAVLLERVRDAKGDTEIDQRDAKLGAGMTDMDGRCRDFVSAGAPLGEGTYRLRFDVGEYFARNARPVFYPEVVVVFRIGPGEQHYHIPLLLNTYGYTTYRGS